MHVFSCLPVFMFMHVYNLYVHEYLYMYITYTLLLDGKSIIYILQKYPAQQFTLCDFGWLCVYTNDNYTMYACIYL